MRRIKQALRALGITGDIHFLLFTVGAANVLTVIGTTALSIASTMPWWALAGIYVGLLLMSVAVLSPVVGALGRRIVGARQDPQPNASNPGIRLPPPPALADRTTGTMSRIEPWAYRLGAARLLRKLYLATHQQELATLDTDALAKVQAPKDWGDPIYREIGLPREPAYDPAAVLTHRDEHLGRDEEQQGRREPWRRLNTEGQQLLDELRGLRGPATSEDSQRRMRDRFEDWDRRTGAWVSEEHGEQTWQQFSGDNGLLRYRADRSFPDWVRELVDAVDRRLLRLRWIVNGKQGLAP
jgi:hypothetical protein